MGSERAKFMTLYQLFLTVIIAGQPQELPMSQFQRFEECWEVAQMMTHNRPGWSARCTRVENK